MVSRSWAMQETSPEPGGVPAVFLLKSLIPAMVALLMLQGVSEVIKNLLAVMGVAPYPADEDQEEIL